MTPHPSEVAQPQLAIPASNLLQSQACRVEALVRLQAGLQGTVNMVCRGCLDTTASLAVPCNLVRSRLAAHKRAGRAATLPGPWNTRSTRVHLALRHARGSTPLKFVTAGVLARRQAMGPHPHAFHTHENMAQKPKQPALHCGHQGPGTYQACGEGGPGAGPHPVKLLQGLPNCRGRVVAC